MDNMVVKVIFETAYLTDKEINDAEQGDPLKATTSW